MSEKEKFDPRYAYQLIYEQGRIIIATAFIALLALLIETNLRTDIEQEIGRLVGNPELAGILANVLLLSVLLFTVYLGFVSILYSIRERSVREVSETFETVEFLAFREGFLFISYSLVLLGFIIW